MKKIESSSQMMSEVGFKSNSFITLDDVSGTYTANAFVTVNSGATGLVFTAPDYNIRINTPITSGLYGTNIVDNTGAIIGSICNYVGNSLEITTKNTYDLTLIGGKSSTFGQRNSDSSHVNIVQFNPSGIFLKSFTADPINIDSLNGTGVETIKIGVDSNQTQIQIAKPIYDYSTTSIITGLTLDNRTFINIKELTNDLKFISFRLTGIGKNQLISFTLPFVLKGEVISPISYRFVDGGNPYINSYIYGAAGSNLIVIGYVPSFVGPYINTSFTGWGTGFTDFKGNFFTQI